MQKAIQLDNVRSAHFWAFPEASVGEFEGVCTIMVLMARATAVSAIIRCAEEASAAAAWRDTGSVHMNGDRVRCAQNPAPGVEDFDPDTVGPPVNFTNNVLG